ncbi:MAG: phosphoribosyltransferase family protein [bacterium]
MVGLRGRVPTYADRTDAGRAVARAVLSDARLRGEFDDPADPIAQFSTIAAGPTRDGPTEAPLVLALPRGGVPVAVPVARALRAELGALAVRRILVPNRRELAMGAVAALSGSTRTVRRADIVGEYGVSEAAFTQAAEVASAECAALARRYAGAHPPDLVQRCVVLVDDGLATGATMTAAAELLTTVGVRRLIVAVPVAAPSAVRWLSAAVSGVVVVCPLQPAQFRAVSQVYRDFSEPDDGEIVAALTTADPIASRDPGRAEHDDRAQSGDR